MMKRCGRESCKELTNNPKYCSLSCSVKSQPRSRQIHTKECRLDSCRKEFEQRGSVSPKVFCSRSCAAKYNNRKRGGRSDCLHCGKELLHGMKYCSKECGGEYRAAIKVSSWLSGIEVPLSERSIPRWMRNYLLSESNYRCASPSCAVPGGWGEVNPITNKTPLTIDHIDGDASNNRRDNLIVLCPNCHSLTPTYGSLNRGNGRKHRRDFYKTASYS